MNGFVRQNIKPDERHKSEYYSLAMSSGSRRLRRQLEFRMSGLYLYLILTPYKGHLDFIGDIVGDQSSESFNLLSAELTL